MKIQKRSVIISVCIGLALLAIILVVTDGTRGTDESESEKTAADVSPVTPEVQDWEFYHGEFMTDMKEPLVLWQKDQDRIYVQDLHLYYQPDGADKQVIHTWTAPLSTQVWHNGEHLLIGSQLIERGSLVEGQRGAWIEVRIEPEPAVIKLQDIFFGPQEVLSVTVPEEPRLFFVQMINGSSFSEYVYDPSRSEWRTVNSELMGASPREMPAKAKEMRHFSKTHKFKLPEGPTVYSFVDEEGSIVYSDAPFYMVWRYVGYEMYDAKLMTFLDGQSQILGRFRSQAGEEMMAFPNWGYASSLPAEPRLWEEGWQALNARAFTHVTPEKLGVVQYRDSHSLKDNEPHYTQFLTKGESLISSQGSLLEYEAVGETKYISFYDIVNTEETELEKLWSYPLKNFITKKEDRPSEFFQTRSHTIPEWNVETNTNAPVPEQLLHAVDEAHIVVDYSYAYAYRKIGNRWFVLVDRYFYEYEDGKLDEIGEVPITVSSTIGEGFSGYGSEDFVRVNDAWIFADTQASRVLKLNDKLEVEAEFAVPFPYNLTIDGDRLYIASASQSITVDTDLKLLEMAPQPFESAADTRMVDIGYFGTQEVYEDAESGFTWYYLGGYLHQYHKRKQEYRSFYIGHKINAAAQVRILPYKDEVIVMSDHRLDRFDRQGGWKSSILFPRSSPDGIYDRTTQGENSLVMDEAAGILYFVQGYRIFEIDLNRNETETVFRQNYADIGELVQHQGSLYFILHSNQDDWYRLQREGPDSGLKMYTEIVKFDPQSRSLRRFLAEEYYDSLEIVGDSGDDPSFVLWSYRR